MRNYLPYYCTKGVLKLIVKKIYFNFSRFLDEEMKEANGIQGNQGNDGQVNRNDLFDKLLNEVSTEWT